uniref:KOW domain-containing protein n=1 Tax=Otolemur garnettii TaxID=30611 RepID=H0XHM2_OTOGA
MKPNPFVTSARNKNCKRNFNAPSHIHRKIMSSPLSTERRQKYNDGEVQVIPGHCKVQQIGKPVQVYRMKSITHTERVQWKKANGTTVPVGIHPSQVVLTRLKLDKDHKKILEGKAKARQAGKERGKYKEETTEKQE